MNGQTAGREADLTDPAPGDVVTPSTRDNNDPVDEPGTGAGTRASTDTREARENHTSSPRRSNPTHKRTPHSILASEANDRAQTVTDSNTSTYEYLLAHYGPLLTLKHVAEVMHTTPAGLRVSLSRRRQPLAVQLAATRRRLGRRMYFEARHVADLIDGCAEAERGDRDASAQRIVPLGSRSLL